MQPYLLSDGLSYCRIGGRIVFLDTERDSYFGLSPALESAFEAHLDGRDLPRDALARLVEEKILVIGAKPSSADVSIENARRSVLELPSELDANSRGALLSLLAILCWTQLRLKTRPLKSVLEGMVRERSTAAQPTPTEQHFLREARVFLNRRRLIPMETCCLPDSISMVTFLARRGIHANLVFGVALDPFSAHCWVQAGDLVLNDAVGNIKAYTPIRVV